MCLYFQTVWLADWLTDIEWCQDCVFGRPHTHKLIHATTNNNVIGLFPSLINDQTGQVGWEKKLKEEPISKPIFHDNEKKEKIGVE